MALFATEEVNKIDDLYRQGLWPKIIQNLRKKPLQEHDDIRLLNDFAIAYQQEKQWERVAEVYERIRAIEPWPDLMKQQAELTPRYMRYHVAMGEALYRQGEYEKALGIFNDLKAVGSHFSDKYYFSGRIHTIQGHFRKALLEFKGMIAHVPSRMRNVIRGLDELIKASPAQAGVYRQLYRACQHKDRVEHYLSRYRKAMKDSPGSIPAALKVANILFCDGKKKEAYGIAQSVKPGSDEETGWMELIWSDWALEEEGVEAAVARLEAAEPLLDPGDSLLIERYEEMAHNHSKSPELLRKLAGLCESGGDLDKACRNLEALVAVQPEDQGARDNLGRLLRQAMSEAFAAGDMNCAGSFAGRLLKVYPDDSDLIAQVEQIAQVRNITRKEKLDELLATGRMPASEAAKAHFEMADIERALGAREDEVISHLQKAAGERSPVRAESLKNLARIHMDRRDFDTAEGVYGILFSMRLPAEERLACAYEVAECFEERGENQLALKYFEQVKSEDPTFRDAASHAGRLSREMEAAVPVAVQTPTAAESNDPMEAINKRYDHVEELGRGAMGVVYKARDKILDRPVAIKTILEDLGKDTEALSRFVTEAQSAAALEHPGIITVYDIHAEVPMFIVMEFVEGKSLNDLLNGRKCPMSHFLNLAIKMCEPIAFAHRAQVVHRDIKPDNIMVTKNGGVKIADFGLSRKGEGSGMTQIGQVMGTPYYMPPEQIKGGATDGRSDIYSLGITLYEMLTGGPPFREGDIAYLHMHEEPPRISLRNPEVSKPLEDIIMKCLKKEPEERFQSVDELLGALRALE